jgi:large subunit ribosomal protein L25
VNMAERITTEVGLTIIGESPAAATRIDAMVITGLSSIQIQCLPGDLPELVEVDISILTEVDQAIFVRDLQIGEGIDILTDPDEMIVRVSTVRMELPEEEEEAAEEALVEGEAAEEGEEPAESKEESAN